MYLILFCLHVEGLKPIVIYVYPFRKYNTELSKNIQPDSTYGWDYRIIVIDVVINFCRMRRSVALQ